MSYARFGWDGSDVYVFGTTIDGVNYIECCGCKMTADRRRPRKDEPAPPDLDEATWRRYTWDFGKPQLFTSKADAVAHFQRHIELRDNVPANVIPDILADDWIGP